MDKCVLLLFNGFEFSLQKLYELKEEWRVYELEPRTLKPILHSFFSCHAIIMSARDAEFRPGTCGPPKRLHWNQHPQSSNENKWERNKLICRKRCSERTPENCSEETALEYLTIGFYIMQIIPSLLDVLGKFGWRSSSTSAIISYKKFALWLQPLVEWSEQSRFVLKQFKHDVEDGLLCLQWLDIVLLNSKGYEQMSVDGLLECVKWRHGCI